MKEIEELQDLILRFRNERNWEQFHNSKDLSIGLSVEAAELCELFLWKDSKEVDVTKLAEELADVLIFSFLIAHNHSLDIKKIIADKIKINAEKYPVEKFKGSNKKYDEL